MENALDNTVSINPKNLPVKADPDFAFENRRDDLAELTALMSKFLEIIGRMNLPEDTVNDILDLMKVFVKTLYSKE